MNRRSILKVLGLGAVAGPSMANTAVLQDTGWTTPIPTYSGIGGAIPGTMDADPGWSGLAKQEAERATRRKRKSLADLIGSGKVPSDVRRYLLSEYHPREVDPDLDAMRSFSAVTKQRIMRERYLAYRLGHLKDNLDDVPSVGQRIMNTFGIYL